MTERFYNVLFLCTGNSARSIMGEVMLNHLGRDRFKAYSAGSHPNGKVNPFAIETMQKMGFSTDGLRSKSWDEFTKPDAPNIDYIFTVCDNAANEVCPIWPGRPTTAHWGVEDPAQYTNPDVARKEFYKVAIQLRRRIELLLALQHGQPDDPSLREQLKAIGKA